MSVLQQMQDMLSPLGVYSLDNNSLVMCELKVYACELEKLHEELKLMLRECFIVTAQSYGIEKIEELFERVRPDLTTDERKERISKYMTLNNKNFSRSDIESQLRLAGVFTPFIQDAENELLSFPEIKSISDIAEIARLTNLIEDIVPAHLDIDTGISSMTWDEIESLDFNFSKFDHLNLRFDLFDK